jgi:hypothetical protein
MTGAWAGQYKAFSLSEAQRQIQTHASKTADLLELGGITQPIGCVHDEISGDVIIVGECRPRAGSIKLDDLVVAMRSMIKRRIAPLVSIDRTPETPNTGLQIVRFEGGIENTGFGADLLKADEVLKQLGLGKLFADIWGLRSYFDLSAEDWRSTGRESAVMSRFWFKPDKDKSFVAVREGVAVINELHIRVETQVMAAADQSDGQAAVENARDEIGQQFAATLTEALPEAAGYYPEIGRLDPLFRLTGLAEAMRRWQDKFGAKLPCLDFWLDAYPVAVEETLSTHPLLVNEATDERDGKKLKMQITGGVELKPFVRLIDDIRKGSPTAFKELVIASKPKGNPLTWDVPLGNALDSILSKDSNVAPNPAEGDSASVSDTGTTLQRDYFHDGSATNSNLLSPATSSLSAAGHDLFGTSATLPQITASSNVGGVMLRGAARPSTGEDAVVDLASGDFSLVVDGENAHLSPEEYRRFITALWAVYFCETDPGISIDPIGPGIDKHLVRYIGQVINSDLGRVMRECDYTMKKWAVGTEKPDIPYFKDVEDHMADQGFRYLFSSRRFWFVPEDMTFKQSEGLLLFADGRMTVKTEYMMPDGKGAKAEPGDEAFAASFTKNYTQIAEKYPIYHELFDYAKLVSLAKYLKESGVPLFWFLMANKDQVLTEDSPGTVDELAKGSKYLEGVTIMGGVDLASDRNYVMDEKAVQAIQQALANAPRRESALTSVASRSERSKRGAEPFSFDLDDRRYSVLPQHSLTSGKDQRGVRYQTDIALRQRGQPGLEVVRYFKPGDATVGEFGQGWRLLIPYRIRPFGKETTEFQKVILPLKMGVVNQLTGDEEVLAFSTNRYSIAGYVPDKLERSQSIGLFIMSNATFRLADKIGNEFWFDGAGFLTDMLFSQCQHIHIEYSDKPSKSFEQPPYQIEPDGSERVMFGNLRVPKRMRVRDLLRSHSEVLAFNEKGDVVGYVPSVAEKSRFKILALLSDASFCLLDCRGNETTFDASGTFRDMVVTRDGNPMVASISQGDCRVTFDYTTDPTGAVKIAQATLSGPGKQGSDVCDVRYHYDDTGRLARVEKPRMQVASVVPGSNKGVASR